MLASSEGSKAWDWEEVEGWARVEQVGGASARDGLLTRWQQLGLSRRSPLPVLPPQLDSPASGMSNEFIKPPIPVPEKKMNVAERQGSKCMSVGGCGPAAPLA